MSYSLSISGHVDEDRTDTIAEVHKLLAEKGAEIVTALRDLDALGDYPGASVSGPNLPDGSTGYINLLATDDAPG